MYRTKHFGWKLTHILGILAHLGLVVTASISYIYHLGRGQGAVQWSSSAAAADNPCGYALAVVLGNGSVPNTASRTLVMTCSVVGTLGLALNVGLFTLLLAMEPTRIMLTEGEQHWRKQVVTFFGCVLNLLLAGAGVGLAVTLGIKTADSKSLIAPLTWASVQAPVALATAVVDGMKNYREGKDLLD